MRKLIILAALLMTVALTGNAQSRDAERNTVELDAKSFKELVADYNANEWKYLGDKPAVIDFYADWCGPCKKIGPVLEKLAGEFDGEVYVYKVNVDRNRTLSSIFEISSIPALMFIPKSGDPEMVVGFRNEDFLRKKIADLIK